MIEENKIGEHPIVSRCMKGICMYVCKAPTPRYQSTWGVSKVTRSITRSEPQGIDIKNLCYAL